MSSIWRNKVICFEQQISPEPSLDHQKETLLKQHCIHFHPCSLLACNYLHQKFAYTSTSNIKKMFNLKMHYQLAPCCLQNSKHFGHFPIVRKDRPDPPPPPSNQEREFHLLIRSTSARSVCSQIVCMRVLGF